jgi:hypothetical protein
VLDARVVTVHQRRHAWRNIRRKITALRVQL